MWSTDRALGWDRKLLGLVWPDILGKFLTLRGQFSSL